MKKSIRIIVAASLIVLMAFAVMACAKGNNPTHTPGISAKPTNSPGTGVLPSASPNTTAGTSVEPSVSPNVSGSPEASTSPEVSGSPGVDDIEGVSEGKVIDEKDVPEDILTAVRDVFGEMKIQSITYDRFQGRQAYKVTLQGEGELAKTCYVYADGTIIIPAMGD